MNREPKLPHRLKWGDRTAARVDEAEYLIGIGVVGYTVIGAVGRAAIGDAIIAEAHESVADEVRVESARRLNERRPQRRVYEEAARRCILQVYKT